MSDEMQPSALPPRSALLPRWIIFFCWAFIILCSVQFILASLEWVNVLYPVGQPPVDLNMFGIHLRRNYYYEFRDILSTANPLFTIIAAYGLLKEKSWAINIAIANAFVIVFDILYSPLFITKGFVEMMLGMRVDSDEFFWSCYLAALILISSMYGNLSASGRNGRSASQAYK